MPGKSSKTRTKSIRFPVEVWDEVQHTAAKDGRTFNEEVVRRLRELADPDYRPPEAPGQMALL